ncbi:DNA-binding transcriptional LysR family regulator [Comamonas odontotermitis]|uniref:DNA-binding transcriptional LysR family regulator n=1 Tax=Comamonas odontotermitis TaxID=379895 RepID=A0ABR6RBB7_9BURK|nr:LysR substrate-binding domain-containing protein [Comamonas odontotermitis]MBB6576426.1 DNA-binding transcriptional LysR family regulator [Comamonas odontotermitis]
MLDLASLAIFLQVAESGSITRAAQQLGRAQSNVTTRIQQLEESLGVPLFVREARRMVLTPEGLRLQRYAGQLLSLAEEAEQNLRADKPSGRLRLGSMESTAAVRLPQPLAQFHRSHPDVQLVLSTAPSRQLVEQLLDHELDAALVAWPAPDLGEPLPLTLEPLYEEPLRLLLPAGSTEHDAPATLAAFTDGCTYRRIGEDWMQRTRGAPPAQVLQLHSYYAILASVAAGSAVAVAPQAVLDLQRDPLPITTLPLAPCTTMFITRNGYRTPAVQQLLSVLQSHRAPDARQQPF